MKILVAVTSYPDNNGSVSLMYIHTRNAYYNKQGIDVTVLSFSCKSRYVYDGITVITLADYQRGKEHYDALVCHASNIRNHYFFLRRFADSFNHIVFFFHGHEVLRCRKIYPKPYRYVKSYCSGLIWQDMYDEVKLAIWRRYLPTVKDKSYFIFVSEWMKNEFLRWTKINEVVLYNRSYIISNGVSECFQRASFDPYCHKEFDFITVRNNLDGSKYAIDIVNRLAYQTPDRNFLVVGKGQYFHYAEKANNITWIDRTMKHNEIISAMQLSRFALMPTRADAQGLMMCEMAAFGIPVVTSDIPICHEIFKDFRNVYYINNTQTQNLNYLPEELSICIKHNKYYAEKTLDVETRVLYDIIDTSGTTH